MQCLASFPQTPLKNSINSLAPAPMLLSLL